MSYKTETHLHTRESSYCSEVPANDIVNLYKERGYKTIICTPHYSYGYLRRIADDWNKRIDYMLRGYKIAKTLGDEIGINILFGIEIALSQTKSDYLIYGITEEFLRDNPDLYNLSLEELVNLCKKNNFLIVQAHPFRSGMQLVPLEYRMPIEIFNGRHVLDARNDLAKKYAQDNNLIGISGTDFHEYEDIPGGIITENEIKTIEEFIAIISNENFENIISN